MAPQVAAKVVTCSCYVLSTDLRYQWRRCVVGWSLFGATIGRSRCAIIINIIIIITGKPRAKAYRFQRGASSVLDPECISIFRDRHAKTGSSALTDRRAAVSPPSTDGAVQSCANDDTALHDIRRKTYSTSSVMNFSHVLLAPSVDCCAIERWWRQRQQSSHGATRSTYSANERWWPGLVVARWSRST